MSFSQKQKRWVEKILSQRAAREVRENSRKIGTVFYSPEDRTVELVIRFFKEGYDRVSSFFGFKIPPFQLLLLYTRQEINQLTGKKTPSWLVGQADFPDAIYLFSPSVWEKESHHKKEDFQKAFCHELTHLFLYQIHPSAEPRWLKEGLAYFVAGQTGKKQFNSQFFFTPELPFLMDTERKWQKALRQGAYTAAFLWVKFLIKRFGKERILKLLSMLKGRYTRRKFSQQFAAVYHQNTSKILEEFFREQKQKSLEAG